MSLSLRVTIWAVSVVLIQSVAAAQAPSPVGQSSTPDHNYTSADDHYAAAEAEAAAGEHERAAKHYAAAYAFSSDTALFVKIAHAYEQAGNCAAAAAYYRRYLKSVSSEDSLRPQAVSGIARCEPKRSINSLDDKKDDPPAPAQRRNPSWQRSAAWASVGLSIAAGATGLVLGLSASSRRDDMNALLARRDDTGSALIFSGTTRQRYQDLEDDGHRLNKLSRIALAVTGASATTAIVLFVLDARKGSEPRTMPKVTVDPTRGVSAAWEF